MERRDFGRIAVVTALGGAGLREFPKLALAAPAAKQAQPLVPGVSAPPPPDLGDPEQGKPRALAPLNPFAAGAGIGIGHRFPAQPGTEIFVIYRTGGIEYGSILASLDQVSYDFMARRRDEMEKHGVRLLNVNVIGLHCDPVVVLGLPGVEGKLERYKQFLRDAGKAGVPYTTYGHMANLRLGYGVTGRGRARGLRTRVFDEAVAKSYPLSHGRVYSEKEIWQSFTRFAKAVVPVAEEAGVHIGLHPDDPPIPTLGGVARVFRNYEGYSRALEISNSPNFGFCLCVGTWAEGGRATGKSPVEMIREFAPTGKIFKIHFRNIDQPLPRFTETFLDDGFLDMHEIMRELRKANFNGVVVPDHVPGGAGEASIGYMIGYMRALRAVVNKEFAQSKPGRA
ncbi:MAG: mannonate dehydratase [Acidobacteria bacterium]|nr:mannonate dehydratase [Acidobacteriota bacterium]